jgi:tetratricopeptide (TPR) repeat protein
MVYTTIARAREILRLVQGSNDCAGVRLKRFLVAVALLWLMAIGGAWSETTEWSKNMESGTAAYKQGRYTEAERALSLAVKESERFGPEDMRLATSLTHLARTYYALCKYPEAESLYRRALAMQEKVLGSRTHSDESSTKVISTRIVFRLLDPFLNVFFSPLLDQLLCPDMKLPIFFQ